MSELRKLTLIVVLLIAVIGFVTAFVPGMIGITPQWAEPMLPAASKIGEISDYKPWFSPLWEPPSGEIETLLFSLQAAIGAGIIGYIAGLIYWQKREKERPDMIHSSIDTIAHTNKLRHTDTRLKVIFAVMTLLITVASTSPIPPILAFIIATILILFAAKINPGTYFLLLLTPFFFGLVSLLMMSLFFWI